MCGIAGVYSTQADRVRVERMVGQLRHRGPDSWAVKEAGRSCVFGHARLSIMDLSDKGAQPMFSHDRLAMAVVNGEIYNFRSLRKELELSGVRFYSGSDSEVVANGFRQWGANLFAKLSGIFALALYDEENDKIFLARDVSGTKPLYYHQSLVGLAFASELKALHESGLGSLQFDSDCIWTYLAHRYLPVPQTAYLDVYKLEPGHFLEYEAGAGQYQIFPYWSPSFKSCDSIDDCRNSLYERFERAVESQLMSDAPVGLLLSGGVDSSAIAAIASRYTDNLNAFCCGFDEEGFDERPFARLSALKAGIPLHETVMTWDQLYAYIPEYMNWFDEPFFNYSAVAIHKLSLMAKKMGIKVLLAGEGADEMFAGYVWYDDLKKQPSNADENYLERFFSYKSFFSNKALETLSGKSLQFDHLELLRRHDRPDLSSVSRGQWLDFHTFLPDDVLCRDDRASMACGIELRVPFLDNDLLEHCFLWDEKVNYRHDERKHLLKSALKGIVDDSILTTRKKGFGFPLERWDKQIRAFSRYILSNGQLISLGYATPGGMTTILETYHAHYLWLLITAELWLRQFIRGENLHELCHGYKHMGKF